MCSPHPHFADGASGLGYVTFVIQHVIYDYFKFYIGHAI